MFLQAKNRRWKFDILFYEQRYTVPAFCQQKYSSPKHLQPNSSINGKVRPQFRFWWPTLVNWNVNGRRWVFGSNDVIVQVSPSFLYVTMDKTLHKLSNKCKLW